MISTSTWLGIGQRAKTSDVSDSQVFLAKFFGAAFCTVAYRSLFFNFCRSDLELEEQLTRALHHITAALAFLHSRFFVHGDLKPQNVMWFETLGRWKLIDMDGLRVPSELVDMRRDVLLQP